MAKDKLFTPYPNGIPDKNKALWELPWNRLQKPLACPAKSLKTLGGVLNPVSFSRQFPKSQK
jgi:hypothetical protein